MKRDMDLIRAVLLKLEEAPAGDVISDLSGLQVDPTILVEHVWLLSNGGYIDARFPGNSPTHGVFAILRITAKGHDLIDSIRDDKVWKKTKHGAAAAGGFTVDLLKDLAKGFVKKLIEEKTGITL